jgi:hypothetical protein
MVSQHWKKVSNACVAKRVRVHHNEKESQERIFTKERGVFLVAKFKKSDADQIR